MQGKEPGGSSFDLPDEVLELLPSDPFEQLDVARKITSIALSTRVSSLESESAALRSKIGEKEEIIDEFRFQIESLDASLSEVADKLARAEEEKVNLEKENASLVETVKKLSRDVAKLEAFRKTLMQSLQEEGDNSAGAPEVSLIESQPSLTNASQIEEEDSSSPPSIYSSVQSQVSEVGNSVTEDRDTDGLRPRISPSLLLASQTGTPWLTPLGSPPVLSGSGSPTEKSKPVSTRRHSFSTSRNSFEDRSSLHSSAPSSHHGPISSDTGRTRVDGKEFFRQVSYAKIYLKKARIFHMKLSRLSYEQFAAFLANVKELNAHKQSKEETLQKADEIFGPSNKDLYAIFEGLITRNLY